MTETSEVRRVSDVVGASEELEGDMFYVRALVGKEFVITGIGARVSENGEYLVVIIDLDGRAGFFFTSHQAVYRKLLRCKDELPLLATIVEREGRQSGRKYFDIK